MIQNVSPRVMVKVLFMLNPVQQAAYELIQSDARFLYSLVIIQRQAKNIRGNYIMMGQPYIGLFTDGAEQWCKKLGLDAPQFNDAEKAYYTALRQSHKVYEMSYTDFKAALMDKFYTSDTHFYKIRRLREKILGYYNVGTDLCNNQFCGNTILGALYTPVNTLDKQQVGPWIRDISVVSGKLAGFFGCSNLPPYKYDEKICVKYNDYHFYKSCPLKTKNELGFILFSILCSINYAVEFIDKYFLEEIPQKFKFAYLQYYYLCDFIIEINKANGTSFFLNDSLKNRSFRNCLAHYGLGQYISESDLIADDPLKGLTIKAFNMDYIFAKKKLYSFLQELIDQIRSEILLSNS